MYYIHVYEHVDVHDHKVVSEESQDEEEEDSVIKEEKEEEEEEQEEEKVYEALVTKVDKESHDYQEESIEYFKVIQHDIVC